MKTLSLSRKLRYAVGCLALLILATSAWRSSAHTSTSVNIVNNSSREIRHVYLSHVGVDDWTGDQLINSTITSGQSLNLSVACDQQQVRVIGEDQDGCFLTTIVNCGDSATWTVTDSTTRDCDG